MGVQLDTLRKQSHGSSNPMQKALAQLDDSLADRNFAADDMIIAHHRIGRHIHREHRRQHNQTPHNPSKAMLKATTRELILSTEKSPPHSAPDAVVVWLGSQQNQA